jgi:hypothetical protein
MRISKIEVIPSSGGQHSWIEFPRTGSVATDAILMAGIDLGSPEAGMANAALNAGGSITGQDGTVYRAHLETAPEQKYETYASFARNNPGSVGRRRGLVKFKTKGDSR